MRCYAVVASSMLCALLPRSANAQESAALPGAQVRVTRLNAPRVDGTVIHVSPDSVVIAGDPGTRTVIRTADIKRVETFEGKSHVAGAIRGAVMMAVVGSALGAMQTPRPSRNCASCRTPTRAEATLATGYIFGLLGEWVGGFVGKDQWRASSFRVPAPLPMQRSAASLPSLDPGLRVRVNAPGVVAKDLEGVIVQSGADSLVLATPKGIRFSIPSAAIAEVRRPVQSGGAGAKVGAGWGAAVYVPMSPFAAVDARNGGQAAGMMFAAAATGTGLGALIGALKGKETWEVIRP